MEKTNIDNFIKENTIDLENIHHSKLSYAMVYYFLATLSFGLLGLIIGLLKSSNSLGYSNKKIILLGILGGLSLIFWGLTSVIFTKKIQDSIKEYCDEKLLSEKKQ